jgi:hypothetical protein
VIVISILAFAYAAWCLWSSVNAMRTGIVTVRGGDIARAQSPADFWAAVAGHWVMVMIGVVVGLLAGNR